MATFSIGFDGPAVEDGEIDVADLAPALIALGDLFTAANQALNQERATARLKVRAAEPGSFVALLSLDVSFLTDLLDAVSAHDDRITAADQLLALMLKGSGIVAGLFAALRFLKGRPADSTERNEDGTTTITINSATIVVDRRTETLLGDLQTREAAEKFVATALRPDGIKSVSFEEDEDQEPALVLHESDITAMRVPEPVDDDDIEEVTIYETRLKIVSAQFAGGYLWRFTDGLNVFTAAMEDQDFLARLDRSEVVLSKNDTLRCVVEQTQRHSGSRLKTETKIVEVKDHVSGARQLRLL